jgi:short-subunit dehydrogenase
MVKTLRGKNAVVTGCSRGLGPVIGGALGREGVNLAVVARSRGPLEEEARKLASRGAKAVAIAADISDANDRAALLRRAEAALGPIDILVNNAAIEETTRFDRQSPETMARTIETNLIAPMLLIREVLPAMLERGRGHIVNLSSMSGKKGLPYGATYAASKAGIIEWTQAMQFELKGTGVGASVVVPGFVTDAGKFASYGLRAPRLAGASSPEQVAEAVVRAIRHDLQEVLVNPGPTRLFLALDALSPALGNALYRRMGVVDMLRPLAESEATNP